jgi:hypothetical protein
MAIGGRPDGLPYLSLQFAPEYQTICEANMADHGLGGQAGDPTYRCLPLGMPRLMGIYVWGNESHGGAGTLPTS